MYIYIWRKKLSSFGNTTHGTASSFPVEFYKLDMVHHDKSNVPSCPSCRIEIYMVSSSLIDSVIGKTSWKVHRVTTPSAVQIFGSSSACTERVVSSIPVSNVSAGCNYSVVSSSRPIQIPSRASSYNVCRGVSGNGVISRTARGVFNNGAV